MKKIIILSAIAGFAFVFSAQAQTSANPTSVEDLQKQVQLLLSQIGSLQKEVASLKSTTPNVATPVTVSTASPTISIPTTQPASPEIDESEVVETEDEFIPPPILTHSLLRGSRGEDVRQLQEFLAQDQTIYPEGTITGYYGPGTEAAVKKWQAKNGVPAVGIIGRQTIAKFKEINSGTANFTPTLTTSNKPTLPAADTPPTQTEKTKPDLKKTVCPTLPTVDSCLAGEERIVTYKSEACGVYYACKPRTSTKADNTLATLKKFSAIQADSRYNLILNDPEGIQKFSIYNSKGAEIHSGFPACRNDWISPTINAESSEFPLKLTLTDCGNPNSFFSTALSTPVIVKPALEGLTFPYKFSNDKIVNSSEEARAYCYANGQGSGQGIAGECETKFGVVYTNTAVNTSVSGARAAYLTDSFATCMTKYGSGAEAKQIKTWAQASDPIPWSTLSYAAQNSVQTCEKEYYGQQTVETGAAMCTDGKDNDGDGFIDSADPSCTGFTTTNTTTTQTQTLTQNTTSASNSNWVSKTWNFKDGQSVTSYILNRTDAEYANYLAPIQAQCLTINKNQFAWKPNAGSDTTSNWQNFGIPDCSGTASISSNITTVSPAGQKEQIWNSLGLKSWIRTDADVARIESLKQACVNTPTGANVWSPNAGLYSSVDFGMPSSDKCKVAATCSTSQYFDGASCVNSSSSNSYYYGGNSSNYAGDANSCPGFAYSRWDSAGKRYCQLNTETRCDYNYPSYLTNGANYTATSCPSSTASSNTSTWCSPLGSGWNVYGNYCLNSSRTQYTSVSSPNTSSVQSCTGTDSPVTGCTPPGGGTTSGTTSCTSGQYWNGSSCVSSTTSTSCGSSPSTCTTESQCTAVNFFWYDSSCHSTSSQYSVSSWPTDQTSCSSKGYFWCTSSSSSGWCQTGTCPSSTSSSSSSSSTCSSGQYWNGSSCVNSTSSGSTASCPSGQYWSGSSCVSSSTTSSSSCSSGQYWNGTACVNSTTPSASVYDQMREQLKAMEIILRGLLGR